MPSAAVCLLAPSNVIHLLGARRAKGSMSSVFGVKATHASFRRRDTPDFPDRFGYRPNSHESLPPRANLPVLFQLCGENLGGEVDPHHVKPALSGCCLCRSGVGLNRPHSRSTVHPLDLQLTLIYSNIGPD